MLRQYAALIKAAKMRPIKFHGLRNTCATLVLQAGQPVHVVSERLGPSKVSMTMGGVRPRAVGYAAAGGCTDRSVTARLASPIEGAGLKHQFRVGHGRCAICAVSLVKHEDLCRLVGFCVCDNSTGAATGNRAVEENVSLECALGDSLRIVARGV